MQKEFGILLIFIVKCIYGDDSLHKEELALYSNMTSLQRQDSMHLISSYSSHARQVRDSNCNVCGRSNSWTIGDGKPGWTADKYPWMVYLWVAKDSKGRKKSSYCGATLINEYFVITAAHCTTEEENPKKIYKSIEVHFVKEGCRKMKKAPAVEHVYLHPGYKGGNVHDISLLKLRKRVRCSRNVSPVCLPHARNLLQLQPTGRKFMVTGWGREHASGKGGKDEKEVREKGAPPPSRELKEAFMIIVPDEKCQIKNSSAVLCSMSLGHDVVCSGDSGSPLFVSHERRFFLIGVHSGRKGKSCESSPKIAGSIPYHMKWITKVTGMKPDFPVTRDGKRFKTMPKRGS